MMTGCFFTSCDSYLDVVPDNLATIDIAFTERYQAEKYLFTLYSYLPRIGFNSTIGRFDDLTWQGSYVYLVEQWNVLRYGDRPSSPYTNSWEGRANQESFWKAIRDCNVFLENISKPRDLNPFEKNRWIAEAKFLKAYYHFLLLQQYGPIPIVDVNLPVAASDDAVFVERLPVDTVFDYIIRLIDEAAPDLPYRIEDVALEMGRLSRSAALSVKAKIAVTAASPLYNGNSTYAIFKNRQGQPFFSDYDHQKWEKAVIACSEAIESCDLAQHDLYTYRGELEMSEETRQILQPGRIYTDKWNEEHIWGMFWRCPVAPAAAPDRWMLPPLHTNHFNYCISLINPTLKAAEMFYSKNGVPIEEDRFYDYDRRYETVETTAADNKFVQTSVQTARLHMNREYRFYGSLFFDGGLCYGLGNHNENAQWAVNTKNGDASGFRSAARYSCSGYYIKKLFNINSTYSAAAYVPVRFNYPIMRLADLYLLYAEALNEYYDNPGNVPNGDVWNYVNLVRERAGLEKVQDAWTNYSNDPDKYTTKTGMREIIRRERSIELMFEGHRFFDILRWNVAPTELTGDVKGWNYMGRNSRDFYQVVTIHNLLYTDRDILSPIPTGEIIKNPNLIQNPGWQ